MITESSTPALLISWQKLNENIRNMMAEITLPEISDAYDQQPDGTGELDYCI